MLINSAAQTTFDESKIALATSSYTVRAGETGLFKFQGRDTNFLPITPPSSIALSFVSVESVQSTARVAYLERFSNVYAFTVSSQVANSAIPLAAN